MRNTLRQAAAVARLELFRTGRAPTTPVAALAFAVILAFGYWLYWRALPPRPEDDRLLAHAFILAAIIGLRFGIASDRALGAESFLIRNLVGPAAYFAGKLAALLTSLLALTAFAVVTGTILSAGDWNHALWYSLASALAVCLFVPILLLVESAMDTRFPGAAAFVLFVVAALAASITIGIEPLTSFLGLTMERLDYKSLLPLAWRAAVAIAITGASYPLWRRRASG